MRLAKGLCQSSSRYTLYILDKSTTGLHFQDITRLLHILKSLVRKGDTIITSEHNTDFIAQADHITELAPAGGTAGAFLLQPR